LIVFSIGSGLFSTSPRNRTSPRRPPSAIATACFFLATSKATKASLYFPMVHPPCLRLGSVRPSNPRFLPARKGGPPAQPANMTSSGIGRPHNACYTLVADPPHNLPMGFSGLPCARKGLDA
jgi:hypothetical protein